MVYFTNILVAAAFLSLGIAAPTEEKRAAPFTVNLVPKTKQSPRNGYTALAKTLAKYGASPEVVAVAAAGAGSVTATPAEDDEEYTAPVTIGSQTFQLDFDTGSSDLWVLGTSLRNSGSSSHTYYSPGSTATRVSGETWSISYGDGSSASGTVYSDTVTIGGTTVTGQYVESATRASSEFTGAGTVEDGLLGLAFDSINTASPRRATTFVTNAINQGLPSKVFTALLKKGAPGSYTFGTIPASQHTGSITYTNVDNSQGFWSFTPTSYAIGSAAARSGSLTGIADTGTTLLLLPDSIVTAYYRQVSGAQTSSGAYIFPCSATLPSLTFTINGYRAVVPGSYINYAPNGDGKFSLPPPSLPPISNLPHTPNINSRSTFKTKQNILSNLLPRYLLRWSPIQLRNRSLHLR